MTLILPIMNEWIQTVRRWAAELRDFNPVPYDAFRWKDWSPVVTYQGTLTVSGESFGCAKYRAILDSVDFDLVFLFNVTGGAGNSVKLTLPFTAATDPNTSVGGACDTIDNNVEGSGVWYIDPGTNILNIFKGAIGNFTVGTLAGVRIKSFYRRTTEYDI